jgi:O-antigen/teichoic acid export membrane protein
MALDAVTGAVRASLQAAGRFGAVAAVELVRKSSQWLIALAVVIAGAGITLLAGGVAAAATLALAAAWFLAFEKGDFSDVSFEPSYASRMLKLAAPMGISAAFVAGLEYADVWLLDFLRSSEDVAVYRAANVFKPVFLAQAVVWAFMPLAFRLSARGTEALAEAGRTAGRFLLIAGAAAAVFMVCGSGALIGVLGGDKYAASAPVFAVMGLSMPFVFVGFLYLHLLTAVDRQILAVYVFAAGLALNVVVDLALIPRYGPLGAMLGTLAAQALMCVAALLVVRRVVGRQLDSRIRRVLAVLCLAVPAAILTQSLGIADMGLGALALMGCLLVLTGGVARRDLDMLKRTFGR